MAMAMVVVVVPSFASILSFYQFIRSPSLTQTRCDHSSSSVAETGAGHGHRRHRWALFGRCCVCVCVRVCVAVFGM
uniref:Secreted protein n=1 Tax=Anopheles darlingi TaxID=43151 RepID=A0A2M4DJT7_ANODA